VCDLDPGEFDEVLSQGRSFWGGNLKLSRNLFGYISFTKYIGLFVCVCVCVCVCDLDRVEFDEVFPQKEPYISVKELCVSAERALFLQKKDAFSCSFCTCFLQMIVDMCDMTR